ncbi:restriction endonuclease-like protein [Saccharibacillus sacchari]|uniref:Restriction endonuclease-like protein n=1 Tax=Saccharibacillus sacchari TaxID=456493 RepID=A0ACC6PHV2_9BACL
MSMSPIAFDSSTELLRIESNLFELYIAGDPLHETAERLGLHRDSETGERLGAHFNTEVRSPRLRECRVGIFSPETGKTERWEPGMLVFPCFYETKAYELTLVKADPGLNLTFHHENVNLRRRVKPRGSRVLSGTLDFGNEIGETELEIRLNDRPLLTIGIEIFPAKLDYRRDYVRLMEEVSEEGYDLTFDFLRRTYRPAEERETSRQSLTEFHTILRRVFERLENAMRRIEAKPHQRLDNEHRLVDAGKARRADRRTLADLRRHPQRLQADRHGWLEIESSTRFMPTRLLEARRVISADTDENRFLRWMLERTAGRVDLLRRELKESRPGRDPLLDRELERIGRRIGIMLNMDFLQDVGPMQRVNVSLVLQMAPGYREMYKLHLLLLKGLSLREGMMRLSLKDMAQLYEYWCFLKLHRLLSRRCRVIRREGAAVDRNGLFPSLIRGGASRIEYEHPESNTQLSLVYNPSMLGRSRPTTEQKPDLLLTLRSGSREVSYVLDAKYRIDPALPGSSYASLYRTPGPLEEDINVMHRYRDAIVKPGTSGYERSVSSACVLFPYSDEREYASHHFFQSLAKVGVGALPFLPGSTRLAERWLDDLLNLTGS